MTGGGKCLQNWPVDKNPSPCYCIVVASEGGGERTTQSRPSTLNNCADVNHRVIESRTESTTAMEDIQPYELILMASTTIPESIADGLGGMVPVRT